MQLAELVEAGLLLPLGTRVRRGEDWKWNNQDTEGPGTVIQHRKKRDGGFLQHTLGFLFCRLLNLPFPVCHVHFLCHHVKLRILTVVFCQQTKRVNKCSIHAKRRDQTKT